MSTPSPPESPFALGSDGIAAAGCLTPSPELSASCTPIPTRTLRARPDSVCYTEPSLKTKMRRPRSPPKPARRRSIKPTPTPTGRSRRRTRQKRARRSRSSRREDTEGACASLNRHRPSARRTTRVKPRMTRSTTRARSPAKPSPLGNSLLDHYRSGHGDSREVHAVDSHEHQTCLERSRLGLDVVEHAREGSDADDERERTRARDSSNDFDETRTLPGKSRRSAPMRRRSSHGAAEASPFRSTIRNRR